MCKSKKKKPAKFLNFHVFHPKKNFLNFHVFNPKKTKKGNFSQKKTTNNKKIQLLFVHFYVFLQLTDLFPDTSQLYRFLRLITDFFPDFYVSSLHILFPDFFTDFSVFLQLNQLTSHLSNISKKKNSK